jgi:hypothetical protein
MNGWNEQMYEKVPAVAKVIVFDSPGASAPVSKLPELVAVCGWVWAFVQVTVPPTTTLMVAGWNLKSPMDTTPAPLAALAATATVVATGVPAGAAAVVAAGAAVVVAAGAGAVVAAGAVVVTATVVVVAALSLLHATSASSAAPATRRLRVVFMQPLVRHGRRVEMSHVTTVTLTHCAKIGTFREKNMSCEVA